MGLPSRLDRSNQAVVASDGTATVDLQPDGGCWWIARYTVATVPGGTTTEPLVVLYRNSTSPMQRLDYTRAGNGDASKDGIPIYPGERLIAAWTGAPVGASAQLRVEGLWFTRVDDLFSYLMNGASY